MSLLTLNPVSTPRNRVYRRAEQYFDINTPGARTSSAIFLPSPNATTLTINNQSAKDKAAQDKRLVKGGLKKILSTRKRSFIKWWLKHLDALIPNGTKKEKSYQSNIKHEAFRDYELQDG